MHCDSQLGLFHFRLPPAYPEILRRKGRKGPFILSPVIKHGWEAPCEWQLKREIVEVKWGILQDAPLGLECTEAIEA